MESGDAMAGGLDPTACGRQLAVRLVNDPLLNYGSSILNMLTCC